MINAQFLPEAFKYEVSDCPRSLFNNGHMRDPGYAKFTNYLCDTRGKDSLVTEDTVQDPLMTYDGGMLLQLVAHLSIKEKPFGEIADVYVSNLVRKTSDTLEILFIFDGYRGFTAKGHNSVREMQTDL